MPVKSLRVGQQLIDGGLIRFADGRTHVELTFTLRGLAGKKMALMGASAFEFSCACFFKTLGGTFVGFDLVAHG
jgi:hypothetical protein